MSNFYKDLRKEITSIKNFKSNTEVSLEENRKDTIPLNEGNNLTTVKFLSKESKKISEEKTKKFLAYYFLDGVQRTFFLGFINEHPLFYHISSSCVLRRKNKKLGVYTRPSFQKKYITSNPQFEKKQDFLVLNSLGESFTKVMSKSNSLRKKLEYQLIKKMGKVLSNNELLFFDGPIPAFNSLSDRSILGVIKRNFTNYLQNNKELVDLKVGEMSRVFLIERKGIEKKMKFTSFYLRLFPGFFDEGLVRVEAPFSKCSSLTEAKKLAKIVFKERFPYSSSSNQTMKKMYPISVVEKYLSSFLPKKELISSSLKSINNEVINVK